MKPILFLIVLLIHSFAVHATILETKYLPVFFDAESINLRIGIQNPDGPILGDILYVHGFADRLDNHKPLFDAWIKAGFRVIAFDLPSHGENSGTYNNLNNFSFRDLANLTAKVEQNIKPDTPRPLILSGWSTGGLIVVRMLQEQWTSGFSRPVSGAILFAPGVSVRKFPWTFGNRLGNVTVKTLTHDPKPPHVGAVDPSSPFWNSLIFKFAPRLVLESIKSQHAEYPQNIPTLIYTAGDREDMYAKASVVREWIKEQNKSRIFSAAPLIRNISCPQSMHEMDNELKIFGATEVRDTAASFAKSIVEGTTKDFSQYKSGFGKICFEPLPKKTAIGGGAKTFWVLSHDYSKWYYPSSRENFDPRPWPAGFSPQNSTVFSHNEIFINSSSNIIFEKLRDAQSWPAWYPNAGGVKIESKTNNNVKLDSGENFTWTTFGTQQKSKVTLYESNNAIGWTADSFGVRAFHRWLLYPENGGTRVVTEECDDGFLLDIGVSLLLNPGLHASHQIWLENLKSEVEAAR